MKFVLMLQAGGHGPYLHTTWSEHDQATHMAFLAQLNRELAATGELVAVAALESPDHARVVRVGADGLPITDGVFPESKEFLAGFWMVDVASAERAYAIAARASLAPGPGGVPLHTPILVRQVLSAG